MSSHLPVIIIGAGPTGLMMACELARYGIPFRVFDKQPEPSKMANAAWIQTRTLEIFDHIGIVDRFLRVGNRCTAIKLYADGKHLSSIPLNTIHSVYPFVLMLPQSETEKILNKRLEELKGRVERPVELLDLKAKGKVTEVILRDGKGRIEKLTCNWVIACDGANSTVREKCNLHFPGRDITEQFMVADADIDSAALDPSALHFFFDRETVFTAMPFGEEHYRIGANLHLKIPRMLYTGKEAMEMVQERAHGVFSVKHVRWVSPFWIHSKMVNTMNQGPVFLAGDAAHLHSPAGGQGMNTGLQDVYNLAWKLAMITKNIAKPSLLESYGKERQPIVKKIIDETEKFTKLAVGDKTFLSQLRVFSKKSLEKPGEKVRKMCEELTQLNIIYKQSSIIDYTVKLDSKSPRQGSRLPNIRLNAETTLYDHMRNTQHNILVFLSKATEQNLEKIKELQSWINKECSSFIKLHVVSAEKIAGVDNLLIDAKGSVTKGLHIAGTAVYVVRPDTCVAYASHNLALKPIKKFFAKYTKN